MPLDKLKDFATTQDMLTGRGALNVGLVMTRRARDNGLPIDADNHVSKSGTQVRGLNGTAGNRVLSDHGVNQSIGSEAGRTNRGAVAHMRAYVEFLNSVYDDPDFDIELFEKFWVDQVVSFFANQPFKIRREHGSTIQSVVNDLVDQALARQKQGAGYMVLGTMLQHLVGAKLEAALAGRASVKHHCANVSDQGGRGGDFDIGDTAIHVTATPGDLLVEKCKANLQAGRRPTIVTTPKGVAGAENLVENRGLIGRVEIYAIDQFVALNINELGAFSDAAITASLRDVIERYNRIVLEHEGNPSLRIDWG